jgi:hypothetical protein
MNKNALASIVLGGILLFSGCSENQKATQNAHREVEQAQTQEKQESNFDKSIPVVGNLDESKTQNLQYEIAKKEDTSIGGVVRYSLRIVVPKGAEQEDIKAISEDIKQKMVEESSWKVRVLVMFFYDRAEDINEPYTVARAIWAPDGEIGKGIEVEEGNYWRHQFKYDLNEKAITPTEQEFVIHDEIKAALKGPGNPYSDNPPTGADVSEWSKQQSAKIRQWEEKVYEAVASKYNITVQRAKEIYLKIEMR